MMPSNRMSSSFNISPNGQESRKNGHRRSLSRDIKEEMKLQDTTQSTRTDHDRNLENGRLLALISSLELGNLVQISDFVKKEKDARIRLPKTEFTDDLYIRVCGLDGTLYSGERFMLESWEELYLPETTKMEVVGILERSKGMVHFPQWIVLVGEDGHVYGYEDEVIHLLANSIQELLQDGIKNIGESYDYPDDLSDEEEEVLQKDKEIQALRKKTRKFIDDGADEMNDFLRSLL